MQAPDEGGGRAHARGARWKGAGKGQAQWFQQQEAGDRVTLSALYLGVLDAQALLRSFLVRDVGAGAQHELVPFVVPHRIDRKSVV